MREGAHGASISVFKARAVGGCLAQGRDAPQVAFADCKPSKTRIASLRGATHPDGPTVPAFGESFMARAVGNCLPKGRDVPRMTPAGCKP